MKFTNILIWSQDNVSSQKFYKKIGFEVKSSTDYYSELSLGGFELVIVNMRDDDEFNGDSLGGDKGRGMYFYIWVDDVDAEYARQLGLGLKPNRPPRDWPWGNREFVLKDPDGYRLCFWHETKTNEK